MGFQTFSNLRWNEVGGGQPLKHLHALLYLIIKVGGLQEQFQILGPDGPKQGI